MPEEEEKEEEKKADLSYSRFSESERMKSFANLIDNQTQPVVLPGLGCTSQKLFENAHFGEGLQAAGHGDIEDENGDRAEGDSIDLSIDFTDLLKPELC